MQSKTKICYKNENQQQHMKQTVTDSFDLYK